MRERVVTPIVKTVVRRKLVALVLALAFGCASFGSAAHRAIVQHVACEHGQLVELGAPTGRVAHPVTTTLSTAAPHDHHHCALDGFHLSAIHRAAPTSISFDPTWPTATLTIVTHEHAPLAYAPKTSPPV